MSIVGAAYHYWSIYGEVSTLTNPVFWSMPKWIWWNWAWFGQCFQINGTLQQGQMFLLDPNWFLVPMVDICIQTLSLRFLQSCKWLGWKFSAYVAKLCISVEMWNSMFLEIPALVLFLNSILEKVLSPPFPFSPPTCIPKWYDNFLDVDNWSW